MRRLSDLNIVIPKTTLPLLKDITLEEDRDYKLVLTVSIPPKGIHSGGEQKDYTLKHSGDWELFDDKYERIA
jgi:hypothetical protein